MIIQKQNGKAVPVQNSFKEKFKMVAKTMMGLEEVLADELRAIGAQNIECINRAVLFEGDMRLLYRANYTCRTALAILKPFAEFEAKLARVRGLHLCSMGERILRCETAPVVALTAIMYATGNLN